MSFGETFTLSNGAKIPQVGYGTWQSKPHEVETGVEIAVKTGYVHLDFAHIYENQKEVGAALKKVIPSVVNREQLFITSKLWNSSHQPHLVEEELNVTLSDLGVDYLDLYLIHWPVAFAPGRGLFPLLPDNSNEVELEDETTLVDTWKAMIALPKNKVRAVGVSNFSIQHIEAIINATGVVPVVNQIELHPRLPQEELVEYCKSKGIHVTAYSPLGNNSRNEPLFTENETVKKVAKRLNATPAQVLIAWSVHRGISVLPKTVTPSRIAENFQQVRLSQEDFEEIASLGANPIRYNIPALVNVPRWDIDIFGDETEKTATHKLPVIRVLVQMDFLSQTYNALRGPTGAPQTPSETIRKLSDRLSQETLLSDRRAAVLSLKGLSKDCKAEVGEISLLGLLDVLDKDSDIDADITKAVLETLTSLCDVNDENDGLVGGKALGMKHTDAVLSTAHTCNKLFQLLGDTTFYTRFGALLFLQTLLQNRKTVVQGYFIKSPVGFSHVAALLEDKREIIRNEGLTMLQALISQNAEIQKILAFEGVFEKLLNIITAEGGIEGGIIVQSCLNSIDGLLRFNVSNLSYFRETSLWTHLTSLFMFPSNLPPGDPAPAEFALQFWEAQKNANMSILVGILGLLVGNKGKTSEQNIFLRCLLELALASNAPTAIKIQALRLLPVSPVLSKAILTPYQPVPNTNGEEWDRLEPTTALNALINNVVEGEYAGIIDGQDGRKQDSLQFRALSLSVFQHVGLQNYSKEEELRLEILQSLIPSQEDFKKNTAALNLLSALTTLPTSPLSSLVSYRIHLSTLLFSTFFNRSHTVQALVQQIIPSLVTQQNSSTTGSYFIPADDGGAHPNQTQPDESDNDERQQTLLQTLTEHLTLSFLSRSRAVEQGDGREEREWDRVIVGYLILLSQWLYDSPTSVREFLDNGGLSVLVEPINQTSGVDTLVQGLCSFLLAICYEYDCEPGEITRRTIYSILHRLTPDILSARMNSVREDDRFKSISPDSIVLSYMGSQSGVISPKTHTISQDPDVEIWFDWNFVEFWKSNFYSMQRAITMDPDTFATQSHDNPEQAAVVSSLREIIQRQATELEQLRGLAQQGPTASDSLQDTVQQQRRELEILRSELEQKARKFDEEKRAIIDQLVSVQEEFNSLQTSKAEADKEQEDLLVFLEELSTKRRRDKERMRNAGLVVSEDEGEGEGEGDD